MYEFCYYTTDGVYIWRTFDSSDALAMQGALLALNIPFDVWYGGAHCPPLPAQKTIGN